MKEITKLIKFSNDPEISADCISTMVSRLENGLDSCTIIANNQEGKNYLAHYKLSEEITVKFAYDEDNPDWDTLKPVFVGNIVELSPVMIKAGETVQVTAIGKGLCLKQMRVAHEYGEQTILNKLNINTDREVNGWSLDINEWTHVNDSPWLDEGDSDKITIPAVHTIAIDETRSVDGVAAHVNDWTRVNTSPWLHEGDTDKITIPADDGVRKLEQSLAGFLYIKNEASPLGAGYNLEDLVLPSDNGIGYTFHIDNLPSGQAYIDFMKSAYSLNGINKVESGSTPTFRVRSQAGPECNLMYKAIVKIIKANGDTRETLGTFESDYILHEANVWTTSDWDGSFSYTVVDQTDYLVVEYYVKSYQTTQPYHNCRIDDPAVSDALNTKLNVNTNLTGGIYYVDGWSSHINDWTHVNQSPWLQEGNNDKITIPADLTYQGLQDGDFTFEDIELGDSTTVTLFKLCIKARLLAGSGGACTSAKVRPSIHDGTDWNNLSEITINSTDWTEYSINVISTLDIANFDSFKLLVTLTDVVDGGATKGNIEIGSAYFIVDGTTTYDSLNNIGKQDGDYTYADYSLPDDSTITTFSFKLRARLTTGSEGQATSAKVKPSIYDGSAWHDLSEITITSTSWTTFSIDVLSSLDASLFNNFKLLVTLTDLEDGGLNKGNVELSWSYFVIQGSYTITPEDGDFLFESISEDIVRENLIIGELTLNLRARLSSGTGGHATNATVNVKIYNGTDWVDCGDIIIDSLDWTVYPIDTLSILAIENFDDFKMAIKLTDVTDGGSTKGLVEISWAYFHIVGLGWDDPLVRLRQILTDEDYGIVPKYLEKILNTEVDSKYSLNTDYVYNDTMIYPYLEFPYQDTFMCLQDLIRLGSSLHYTDNPSDWKGLHWMVDVDGNLLIAPVGDHNIEGAEGYTVEDKWPTRPLGNDPLVVKQDMITQAFKTEIPLANYVLVAGKYITPKDDAWTESTDDWYLYRITLGEENNYTDPNHIKLDAGIVRHAVKFLCPAAIYDESEAIAYREIPINLASLVTKQSGVIFGFAWCEGSGVETVRFRLYKNRGNYFEYSLGDFDTIDEWYPVEVILTQKDLDAMANGKKTRWSMHGSLELEEVRYIGISVDIHSSITLDTRVFWIDDFKIVGNIIRGAYDSGSITQYGCRFLTIKDSLASTDSLDSNDDSSPLSQLTLYELLRARVVRTSGKIDIPLNPILMGGQIVHIHAGYDPDYTNPDTGSNFEIDKDFRITEARHSFTKNGVFTSLSLTDDLLNSIPIDTMDPYSTTIRAVNPDYQTRTYASLKVSGGDFDLGLLLLTKDYTT